MVNLFDELKQRGLIKQTTNESEVKELINNGKACFYVGIDPTASSLHIGHLIVLTFVKRLIQNGNKAIIVIGGGTSLIGDPSNKNDMRKMLSNKDIKQNCKLLKKQLKKIFSGLKITILNNDKWLSKQKFLDFIRQIGIFFNINEMIKADCYQQRINNGLTFLEFSYMLLQAYDFYYLNKKYGCNLQIGGNDQWCNMLAGVNIIKKNSGVNINVLTIKLLTDSNGNKMGKTENGAIWLDQDKISEEIYKNFWINIPDNDLFNYIKMLSFEKLEEIAKKEKEFQSNHNIENINKAKEEFANEMLKYRIKIFKFSDLFKKIKKIFQSKKNNDILFCNFYKNDDNISVREILVQSKKYQNKKEVLNLIRNKKILVNDKVIDNYNYQLNENDIVIVDNKYQFKIKKVDFKDLDVETKKNFCQKLMIRIENKNFDWDQKFKESFSDAIYFFKKNSEEKKEKIYEIFIEKILKNYFDINFEKKSFNLFFLDEKSFDHLKLFKNFYYEIEKNNYLFDEEKSKECKNINEIIKKKIKGLKPNFIVDFFHQEILNVNIFEMIENFYQDNEDNFIQFLHDLIGRDFPVYTNPVSDVLPVTSKKIKKNADKIIHVDNIPVVLIAIFKFFQKNKYFFYHVKNKEKENFLKKIENNFYSWCANSVIYPEIIKTITGKEPYYYEFSNNNKNIIPIELIPLILIIVIITKELSYLKNQKYKEEIKITFKREYEKQKEYKYLESDDFETEVNNYKNNILDFLQDLLNKNHDEKNKEIILRSLISFFLTPENFINLNNENNQNN